MDQRKLSRLLMVAGGMAVLGVVFLFYVMALFLLPSRTSAAGMLFAAAQMAMGMPYLIALWHYFRICKNIGDDRSFCPENARRMDAIARLLFIASGLWAAGLILIPLLGSGEAVSGYITRAFGPKALYVRMALALLATLAVGLVAEMMALLVGRASRLQEENDLTI